MYRSFIPKPNKPGKMRLITQPYNPNWYYILLGIGPIAKARPATSTTNQSPLFILHKFRELVAPESQSYFHIIPWISKFWEYRDHINPSHAQTHILSHNLRILKSFLQLTRSARPCQHHTLKFPNLEVRGLTLNAAFNAQLLYKSHQVKCKGVRLLAL